MSEATTALVSIVIDNYNYGRYLREAIDSALGQTYLPTEVIVVDDGSTDESREIIAAYGTRITPVLKQNGGQASALNAGFAASRGEVVLFLDSDDRLFPDAVKNAVGRFANPKVTKLHWPLWIVDETGTKTGGTKPHQAPPEGDFREVVLQGGPSSCVSSPTSGNAWARWFLDKVMPMPEDVDYYKICADEYLYTLAPVFGPIRSFAEPQGFYRIHGSNIYSGRSFHDKLRLELAGHAQQCAVLSRLLREKGIHVDLDLWRKNSWFHRLNRAIEELEAWIPGSDRFILIDDQTCDTGDLFAGRRIPFIERDGEYWGPPPDDSAAIDELERLRRKGVGFAVFAWPAFWWLDHYPLFHRYLSSRFRTTLENERLAIFDLRQQHASL